MPKNRKQNHPLDDNYVMPVIGSPVLDRIGAHRQRLTDSWNPPTLKVKAKALGAMTDAELQAAFAERMAGGANGPPKGVKP